MNILIVGSGAREHAIARALQRSAKKPQLFCCGTHLNPGIQALTKQYAVNVSFDVNKIVAEAKEWQIDFAFIGPEAALEKGIVDELQKIHIQSIGPTKTLARIETSKAFARELMRDHYVPGLPQYRAFNSMVGVAEYLQQLGPDNYVIKANGLMGGKGVKIAGEHLKDRHEAQQFCEEIIASSQTFIIEERLIGQEFSQLSFCDGSHLVHMPLVQDHKRAYVGDKGPNTGGMGSYSDADHRLPFLTADEVKTAQQINNEIIDALNAVCGERYVGILYGSYIATYSGVYVIEFNARFGDPEALNLLAILTSDLVSICEAMMAGNLTEDLVQFAPLATVCKYAVPEGYPDAPLKNTPIDISNVTHQDQLYFGAVEMKDGKLMATGSRALAVVGVGKTLAEAENLAEAEMQHIHGQVFHREDIGTEDLIMQRKEMMGKLRALPKLFSE